MVGPSWQVAPTEVVFRDSDHSSRAHPSYVPSMVLRADDTALGDLCPAISADGFSHLLDRGH